MVEAIGPGEHGRPVRAGVGDVGRGPRELLGSRAHIEALDEERERDFDAWIETGRGEPLALGGPLLSVATDHPVDVGAVVGWIREQPAWTTEPVMLTPTAELGAIAHALVAQPEALLPQLLPNGHVE